MDGFSAFEEQEVIIQDGLLYTVLGTSQELDSQSKKQY